MTFSGDVSAKFDIDTFNGDIDNCFGPEAVRTSKYTPGWVLFFTYVEGVVGYDFRFVVCADL